MLTREEMQMRKRYLQLTYEDISRLSGVPLGTVQKYLMGYTDSPRYSTLEKLNRVLAPTYSVNTAEDNDRFVFRDSAAPAYAKSDALDDELRIFGKRQGEYTIDDYLNLPDDVRFELIDGTLYEMASPSVSHQQIAGNIYFELATFVRNQKGPCKVFISPLDVRIDVSSNKNMVQPDVMVICDQKKISDKNIQGAPDLIVEVISPGSARKDLSIKRKLYKRAGVREFWAVDPRDGHTIVFTFDGEKELIRIYDFDEEIPVGIWNGECKICIAGF